MLVCTCEIWSCVNVRADCVSRGAEDTGETKQLRSLHGRKKTRISLGYLPQIDAFVSKLRVAGEKQIYQGMALC